MQLTRLRLGGFKSFVEPTELLIDPGLTGIVGPNGCGKSNLVEALQWVMGEGSARRLRGGDMDDVIFAGTTSRAGKSVAFACIELSEVDQRAGQFQVRNGELEIERRIVRGKGSTYRANGREERARDVQNLFADAASGAQSVSLIGQGRIGWLINARPSERRVLLEEAAGIAGLQTRRREAENKLAAADSNLLRLADLQAGLVAQIERLKKQARSAVRYRKLSEEIALTEAASLHRSWADAVGRAGDLRTRLADARNVSAARALELANAELVRDTARTELSECRMAVGAAEASLVASGAQLQAIEAETARVESEIEAIRRRLVEGESDAARERTLVADASRALTALAAEAAALEWDNEADLAGKAEILAAIDRQTPELVTQEEAQARFLTEQARTDALRAAAQKTLDTMAFKVQQTVANLERIAAQIGALRDKQIGEGTVAAAESEIASVEAALAALLPRLQSISSEITAAEDGHVAARRALGEHEQACLAMETEAAALKRILAASDGGQYQPVINAVRAAPGFEAALAASLGDTLSASRDPQAPRRWTMAEGPAVTALPSGTKPLADKADAPPELARRLAAIGIVEDVAAGDALKAQLQPGQMLVTPAGQIWRWDGYCVAAGADSQAVVHLAQRNRLNEIERSLPALVSARDDARQTETTCAGDAAAARRRETLERATQLDLTQCLSDLRRNQAKMLQTQMTVAAELRAALEREQRLVAESDAQRAENMAAETSLASLPDSTIADRRRAELRNALDGIRANLNRDSAQLALLERDLTARARRQQTIADEQSAWQRRQSAAEAQLAAHGERHAAIVDGLARLTERPALLAGDRAKAAEQCCQAQAASALAESKLAGAEATLTRAEASCVAAVMANTEIRETAIRVEAAVEFAEQAALSAARQIREQFQCPPDAIAAKIADAAHLAGMLLEQIEQHLAELRRDRDALGPVNLVAEAELASVSTELDVSRAESADLTQAIARLRQAIREINHEGRARLQAAFDAVNAHFQGLFTRLFGGGNARLDLVFADDDPLAAGLEILASPPGKKLQLLSLLSGGERALTALALVFAAFLANPAPICVLDEVDAPLDDANVERFCTLVREIAERAGTRFLIVTHHRATMARMDRLYGVTMLERGVSRLVSVELQAAEQLRLRA